MTKWLGGLVMLVALVTVAAAADLQWTPDKWTETETLSLCTTGPEEGSYCFPVWLVVIDNNVYVRLGSTAAGRVEANTTGMVLPVDIKGQRFEKVRATTAPDYAERVNAAMRSKYWSDIFIGWLPHPLTLRLTPESTAS